MLSPVYIGEDIRGERALIYSPPPLRNATKPSFYKALDCSISPLKLLWFVPVIPISSEQDVTNAVLGPKILE
jgi:hypothetical protein